MENENIEQKTTKISPPHIRSMFYKIIGERNLLASDLQRVLQSNNETQISSIIESVIDDIAKVENKLYALQKLFPELLSEEEEFRQFSLGRRLNAIKQSQQEKKDDVEIKGEQTDIYEDGKIAFKFK